MKRLISCLSGLAFTFGANHAYAQSVEYELGQIVVTRKPMMFDLQTAYWTLLAVKNGESDDYQGAAEVARTMSEIMGEFVLLMEPGTARGEAPGSRAKPEVWSDAAGFAAAAEAFQTSAAAFADTAATGDAEAYSEAFDDFTAACTACHGFRPSSGGPFRFAKGE